MRQGSDRRDVGQSERDFVLELLFRLVEDADDTAVFVDYLRELVFCRGDCFSHRLYLLPVGFYLLLGLCSRTGRRRFGTLHLDVFVRGLDPCRGWVVLGGGGEGEGAVRGSEAPVLKGASANSTLVLAVRDQGPDHTFGSLFLILQRQKDYNLHAKYVMKVEMACERYKRG